MLILNGGMVGRYARYKKTMHTPTLPPTPTNRADEVNTF